MSTVSKISQFVLGFILAIALLFLAGAGLTRYLLSRIATLPPRPSFTNDPSPVANASPTPAASPAPVNAAASPVASPVASPAPSPSPSPSPSPQGYPARVVQPIGLRIRQSPSIDAATVGGVEYNREVVVLEDSPDGAWQKIRAGSAEGWVKGGNTERMN